MNARLRAPKAVKRLYRAARTLRAPVPCSRALPQSLLNGCQMCASRIMLLERLPKGGVVAELGTYKGDFAREILRRNAPEKLHLVDITFSHLDKALLSDRRVVCHEGLTHEVISRFPDEHFDWIYIDAGHLYDSVLRDARCCAPKLRPNGFLVFNDFAHVDVEYGRYGVHRAVVDFALEKRWEMRYFAMQPAALYDVALLKPMA